jgi:CheY-like chemotaxis protein
MIVSDGRATTVGRARAVLVVDDVATARDVTCRFLAEAGYRPWGASCAAQALEVLASARPAIELVITDVVMPEVSGVELVRRIRKRWPAMRVVFMSAYDSAVLRAQGLERASVMFLSKPFTGEQLLATVSTALSQRAPVDQPEARVPWPFPTRRMREPKLTHEQRLELLREIREGADSLRGPGEGAGDAAIKAKLAEWEELEALRDIRVRLIWDTGTRTKLLAAFAMITPSGEALLEEQMHEPA